jgi:hypothetical protein
MMILSVQTRKQQYSLPLHVLLFHKIWQNSIQLIAFTMINWKRKKKKKGYPTNSLILQDYLKKKKPPEPAVINKTKYPPPKTKSFTNYWIKIKIKIMNKILQSSFSLHLVSFYKIWKINIINYLHNDELRGKKKRKRKKKRKEKKGTPSSLISETIFKTGGYQ